MEQTNNIVRNWLLGIGVALVALVGLTFLVHRDGTPKIAEIGGDATTSTVAMEKKSPIPSRHVNTKQKATTSTTTGIGESLIVNNQPAGDMVAVSPIKITRPTWVAVRGQNGWILGAGLYFRGDSTAHISLLRPTKAGEKYEALMFVDNGNTLFELHKDSQVSGVLGSFVAN